MMPGRVKLLLQAALTVVMLTATAVSSYAAIAVTRAEISAGRLVVQGSRTGTAPSIILDGQFTAGVIGGAFAFSLLYLPPDCMIDLKGDGGTAGALSITVDNCGETGLSPRGAWSNAASYSENDVVTDSGSSYRAKRVNSARPPDTSGADWEVLTPRGQKGQQGIQGIAGGAGSDGQDGATGSAGVAGAQGSVGPTGATGNAGAAGATGSSGPSGTTGVTGPAGPAYLKRVTFTNVTIPGLPSLQAATLASINFTSPVSGTAVLRGRGFCAVNLGNAIAYLHVAGGFSAAVAVPDGIGDTPEDGVMRNTSVDTYPMWTSETAVAVTAGAPTTVGLYGRVYGTLNGAILANCTGTFHVEIATGTLP